MRHYGYRALNSYCSIDCRPTLRRLSQCTLAGVGVLVVHAARAGFNRSATAALRTTTPEPAERFNWTCWSRPLRMVRTDHSCLCFTIMITRFKVMVVIQQRKICFAVLTVTFLILLLIAADALRCQIDVKIKGTPHKHCVTLTRSVCFTAIHTARPVRALIKSQSLSLTS